MGTDSLLMLYKSLLRSVLDYGCQAFNSASITVKSKLDIIQAKALRIVLGAHKSTPLETILAESGEMPLQLRRDHLSLKYYARTKQNPSNPANQLVDDCIEYQIYNHKWNDHNIPYGFRVQNLLKDNELDKIKMVTKNIQDPPPWIIGQAKTSSNIKNQPQTNSNTGLSSKTKNIEVTIEWIPAHVGILGNEQVDKLAKLALSNDKIDLNLSLSANEFIAITTALYKKKWQARWDNTCSIWSRSINTAVNKNPTFIKAKHTARVIQVSDSKMESGRNRQSKTKSLQIQYVLKKRSLRRPATLQELSGSVTQKWSQAITGSTDESSRRLTTASLKGQNKLQELSGQ
ncbi:unnamed protein product [Mytilus edulis]|uniref:RNase H type-1 domain-containing protein n=1 Tax=Mytilus edulis TaxID=6550 RepID=A0A8S3SNQ4_MYTED|nr:unnamed protein product [Mytilus edulis]